MSTKIQSIEAARAVAALSVVLMHAANLMRVEHFTGHIGMNRVFDFGYVGVDFFFVLSGFVIAYVHGPDIGRPERVGRYLWRRFSRIYPIYWFILLMTLLIVAMGRTALGRAVDWDLAWSDVPATVFLLMTGAEPKYVGVAWSLQYEVLFYLMFALLILQRSLGLALLGTWGVLLAGRIAGWHNLELPFNLGSAHCLQFLAGAVLGYALQRGEWKWPLWSFPLACFGIVLATVFEVYGPYPRHSDAGRLALGLASVAMIASLVAAERAGRWGIPRAMVALGSVSYSVYLGHIVFINLTFMLLLKAGLYHRLPESMIFGLGVVVSVGVSTCIGLWVEKPMMRKCRRFPAGVKEPPRAMSVAIAGQERK